MNGRATKGSYFGPMAVESKNEKISAIAVTLRVLIGF